MMLGLVGVVFSAWNRMIWYSGVNTLCRKMPIYRKKPIEIEAFQLTYDSRKSNADWPEWLHEAWNKEHDDLGSVYPFDSTEDGALAIHTLEGVHKAEINDYIIKGIKGELYPCKPDIFEASYDLV